MFERFTDRARRVLVLAQDEARLLGHNFIGTEHLLLGLIAEREGIAAKSLQALGISLEAVRGKVEETIGPAGTATTGSPPFTPRARKVLELSLREALQLGHNFIGTEHMLLGLVREGEGVGVQVLVALGAGLSQVRQQVIMLMEGTSTGSAGEVYRAVVPPAGTGRGPRCPACRGPLDGHVGYRVLRVPAVGEGQVPGEGQVAGEGRVSGEAWASGEGRASGEDIDVIFVYCLHCGVMAAHAPAGQLGLSGLPATTPPARPG